MFITLLYIILTTTAPCWSTVTVTNPLDCQFPLIARVDRAYSWSFSGDTFASSSGAPMNYNASLPDWLTFNPSNQTLFGTPTDKDIGRQTVVITASDLTSSAYSSFDLCVTPFAAPTLQESVASQFYANNTSLSSVFLLAPGSAIETNNAALRVPPGWSFSVGFDGNMFAADNGLYYAAKLDNGSALPNWLRFDPKTVTFNGVAPEEYSLWSPQIFRIALLAADQEGYSASSAPFDLVVAQHELSMSTPTLPTINVTADTDLNLSMSSPADYSGLFVDGRPLKPDDIGSLSIDTSPLGGWLKYDGQSRTLSGTPPADLSSAGPLLPVIIVATFNQTIVTNVSLAVVASFFISSTLPTFVTRNGSVDFNLVQYFSNTTTLANVNLTAACDPIEACNFLEFDPDLARLTGTIPSDFSPGTTHITVTFTAYSHITHSTSHTSLPIALTLPSNTNHGVGHSHLNGLSAAAHARLVLGLEIAFGLVGGLAILGVLLAVFRRCARVADTALAGEEGMNAWTENDRKWYGIDTETDENGYGWTEKSGRPAMEIRNSLASPARSRYGNYGGLGFDLQRVLTRTTSNPRSPTDLGSQARVTGAVMRKAEFFGKIRETVRHVSDKYTGKSISSRPAIGRPVLVTPTDGILDPQDGDLPFENVPVAVPPSVQSFKDVDLRSYVDTTANTLTESPSSSTEDRSIPRRRADFAPRGTPQVQIEGLPSVEMHPSYSLARLESSESVDSLGSNTSARTHAAEAIVQTAARATSARCAENDSGVPTQPTGTRPRLVPFTSAARVPVPRLPSAPLGNDGDHLEADFSGPNKRITSQTAKVMEVGQEGSLDDLSIGMHYVRSLGGDQAAPVGRNSGIIRTTASTPTVSTNVRSSFSSLESSRHSRSLRNGGVKRMLVRTGERFKFRITLDGDFTGRAMDASLVSGRPLPDFLNVDVKGASKPRGVVVFQGTPVTKDIGDTNVGVYTTDDGECVGRVIIEVVGRGT